MRYPAVDDRTARERDGNRYVGSYVRKAGTWKRTGYADLQNLLVFHLEDSYADVLYVGHPFVKLARSRGFMRSPSDG